LSPVAADRVYAIKEDGEVYVIGVGRTYRELALDQMDEPVMATPAASVDTLWIRGAEHLFALHKPYGGT